MQLAGYKHEHIYGVYVVELVFVWHDLCQNDWTYYQNLSHHQVAVYAVTRTVLVVLDLSTFVL